MTPTEPVQRVLGRLEAVRRQGQGYSARCPAHDDRVSSLTVGTGQQGQALLRCHAGCTLEALLQSLGLETSDLFISSIDRPGSNGNGGRPPSRVVDVYPYTDEDSVTLYEMERRDPKSFRARRPDGKGGYHYNINGVRRVLFRLPRVIAAVKAGSPIFVVEGEKDVLALEAIGLTATTNTNGAAAKWLPSYSESLIGADVIVIPDNDEAGRKHAGEVRDSLRGKAKSIVMVDLPGLPTKGDVSDWLTNGGTRAALEALVIDARSQQPASLPLGLQPRYRTMAEVQPETVEWLSPGRVPLAKLTIMEGDPGLGKTMVALDLAARVSRGESLPGDPPIPPADVVYLTGEDGVADTIRPRLEAAGADLTKIHALDGVVRDGRDEGVTLPDHAMALQALVQEKHAKLVIVDVLNAFLSNAVDAYRDHDIRRALLPLKQMAETSGAAVICIRHLKKTAGARGIAAGGGSIGIGGAARSVLVVDQDPSDSARRVLASVKCNLAAPAPSLSFSLESTEAGVPAVRWSGRSSETADSLAVARMEREGAGESGTKADEAAGLLESWLGAGEMEKMEVYKLGRANGVSDRTLERAAQKLCVYREQRGFAKDKKSYWSLRPTNPATDPIGGNTGTIEELGMIGELQALTEPVEAPISQSCKPAMYGRLGGNERFL